MLASYHDNASPALSLLPRHRSGTADAGETDDVRVVIAASEVFLPWVEAIQTPPQLDFIHFLRTEKPCDIST